LFSGVGVTHLIERTGLVGGGGKCNGCIAVSRAEIVGKFNTGTEREREDRWGTKQLTRGGY
jgi:hypothetical protein